VAEQPHLREHERPVGIDRRDAFLLQMYTQLWNNVNRHLTVTWQAVGVLGGSMAILALVEKSVLPLDYAASLVVIISAWLVVHSYDASNWFNRNQTILVNIERQFLKQSDLREIHPYFTGPREPGNMIGHVRIQQLLAIGVAVLILLYHFMSRVWPGIERLYSGSSVCQAFRSLLSVMFSAHGFSKTLPYLTAIVSLLVMDYFRQHAVEEEKDLIRRAPGKSELR
jgi:hypothetical protein